MTTNYKSKLCKTRSKSRTLFGQKELKNLHDLPSLILDDTSRMNTELAENEQNKGSITKNQGFNPHARKIEQKW